MTHVALADLGWCIAKITVTNGVTDTLQIISPAGMDDTRYAPAESVRIFGRSNLVKLQEFLDANLRALETE